VDYNRAGQALLEIVSEPDMRSGQDAAAYGAELHREQPVAVMKRLPGMSKNEFTKCVHQLCTPLQRNQCGSSYACNQSGVHCKHCACCSVFAETHGEVDVVVYFDDRIWELHTLQHDG